MIVSTADFAPELPIAAFPPGWAVSLLFGTFSPDHVLENVVEQPAVELVSLGDHRILIILRSPDNGIRGNPARPFRS